MVDRRQHTRLSLEDTGSRAWSGAAAREQIALTNVSSTGLCLQMDWPYPVGAVHKLWLDRRGESGGLGFVTVVVRWKERLGDSWYCGVEVVTSDCSWLQPDENAPTQ